MNKTAQIILLATCFLIPNLGSSEQSDPLLQDKLLGERKEAEQALDLVLANDGSTRSVDLFMASASALKQKRYVDSAYLFYIAKFRVALDNELFPPVGTGGNSPMVLCGALSQQLGTVINPEIMRRPSEFLKALEKTKNWIPEVPKRYNPGWEYTAKQDVSKAKDNLKKIRSEFNKGMGGLATLLNKPNYFSSFKIAQAYNMTFDDSRPSKEKYDEAVAKMTQIEKDSGIEGMFYTPEKESLNASTAPSVYQRELTKEQATSIASKYLSQQERAEKYEISGIVCDAPTHWDIFFDGINLSGKHSKGLIRVDKKTKEPSCIHLK